MNPWYVALAVVAAYLLGSIDFAVLVSRMKGVDILAEGSGNPGTANVARTLGRGPAAMVLAGDVIKGVLAASMGTVAAGPGAPVDWLAALTGLVAVVGHCFPVWHRFRGGKGVATYEGMILWLNPLVGLIVAVVYLLIVLIAKVSSIASLSLVVLAVPLLWWQGWEVGGLGLVGLAALLVIVRHRSNIRSLLQGEERKMV
ncbi:MAG: glycerol-3-phosphate 1-O-acyltransferase PlsY [Acidimicrobiia bacterium]|nr:glycerol-3-phosphate 1-O-acyltransferase PlsY [Acidimicrobiia bacterium]